MGTFSWLMILLIALVLMLWGRWLTIIDEIYSLAVYTTSILMVVLGLAIAPSNIPVLLGILALGWIQLRLSKS